MQIGHAIRDLSQFIVGFAIGFTSVWQLTLLSLAVAEEAYTITISTLSGKGEAAYAKVRKGRCVAIVDSGTSLLLVLSKDPPPWQAY
ncbi:ABC transporter B family member 13 [Senna tora]|uniref:ABC transporter B family member 13 n=1 Tax=Senna tora TaxID=362788 RepID=A0A834WCT9_9FABA|nr:ABC transporter B family member 13 [Senna tora]